MSNYRTSEEVKADYIKCMGEPLGKLFHALWQEVAFLHTRWAEFVGLYGKKQSRIDLLNQAAPFFFRVIQDTLWESTILHIARLTDPPKSAGKHNLTIQKLPCLITDEDTRKTVMDLVKKSSKACNFCRSWRNRALAHRDLDLAVKEDAEPLDPANRQMVEHALASIANVLNAVQSHYTCSIRDYKAVSPASGAVGLLRVIDDGLKVEAERRTRGTRGEVRKL